MLMAYFAFQTQPGPTTLMVNGKTRVESASTLSILYDQQIRLTTTANSFIEFTPVTGLESRYLVFDSNGIAQLMSRNGADGMLRQQCIFEMFPSVFFYNQKLMTLTSGDGQEYFLGSTSIYSIKFSADVQAEVLLALKIANQSAIVMAGEEYVHQLVNEGYATDATIQNVNDSECTHESMTVRCQFTQATAQKIVKVLVRTADFQSMTVEFSFEVTPAPIVEEEEETPIVEEEETPVVEEEETPVVEEEETPVVEEEETPVVEEEETPVVEEEETPVVEEEEESQNPGDPRLKNLQFNVLRGVERIFVPHTESGFLRRWNITAHQVTSGEGQCRNEGLYMGCILSGSGPLEVRVDVSFTVANGNYVGSFTARLAPLQICPHCGFQLSVSELLANE